MRCELVEQPAVQIPFGFNLAKSATFENFIPDGNEPAARVIAAAASGQCPGGVFLWGALGTGKTHLLQATCLRASQNEERAAYIPLRDASRLSPGVLLGLEELDLVCCDDLDEIYGDSAWEEGLFHLYNKASATGARLVFSARGRALASALALEDLASRLSACLSFRLVLLDEPGRCRALRERARERGFDIPAEVIRYVVRRVPRDMHSLFGLLERIDHSTLAEKRRVTIPFVKTLLGHRSG